MEDALEVYLVRHGPTHQSAMIGWSDVPADLSDAAQIAATRALLPAAGYMVSSDLQRAVRTADVLGEGFQRAPHDPDLREFNFGQWDGKAFDTIEAESPGALQTYFENPGETRAPMGENWNDVEERTWAAMHRHAQRAGTQPLILVAHMGVVLCLLRRASGQRAYEMMAQKISPLSVSKIRFEAGQWHVLEMNALGHP